MNKYEISWIVIPEKRKKTSKAGLKRLNKAAGISGFAQMENAYIRHFPNKQAAEKIQKLVGGIIITDAQFAKNITGGNIKLNRFISVQATKKQIQDSLRVLNS